MSSSSDDLRARLAALPPDTLRAILEQAVAPQQDDAPAPDGSRVIRVPGENGHTARLTGMMHDTTERCREVRRLTYLATRDELTGHLNRNALREELSGAIDSAKVENRNCAFLVASIDRLAMINDSFGFDAGEEVIMGVGDRHRPPTRSTQHS